MKEKDNKKVKGKIKKIICVVIFCVIILILLCFIPDLLLHMRTLLKKIKLFNMLAYPGVTDIKYMEIILTLILNCVAIIISVFALYTSKSSAKTQIIQQRASLIKASNSIREVIENNMKVIDESQKNTGNINELLIDKSIIGEAASLYGAQKITLDEFKYFKNFTSKIYKIHNLHNLNQDVKRDIEINEFVKKYFKENTIEYSSELDNFCKSLDNIVMEENDI